MDLGIPNRVLTKEEISRCYLKWQQLRNLYGENAPQMPEFITCTRILQRAAKQQQDAKQQLQQRQQQLQNEQTTNSPVPNDVIQRKEPTETTSPGTSLNGPKNVPTPTNNTFPSSTSLRRNSSLAQSPKSVRPPNENQFTETRSQSNHIESQIPSEPNDYQTGHKVKTTNLPLKQNKQDTTENLNQNFNNDKEQINHIANGKVQEPHNTQDSLPVQSPPAPNPSKPSDMSQSNVPKIIPNNTQNVDTFNKNTQQSSAQAESNNIQRPHHSNLFTNEQSTLLKAQITALKCLVNQQSVPEECQSIIQGSINNPPDFRRMLMSLSEFVRRQTNQNQGPEQQNDKSSNDQLNSQSHDFNNKVDGQEVETNLQERQTEQKQQLQDGKEPERNHQIPDGITPPHVTADESTIHASTKNELSTPQYLPIAEAKPIGAKTVNADLSPKSKPQEEKVENKAKEVEMKKETIEEKPKEPEFVGDKEPPKPQPPILLDDFKALLSENVENVIDVKDPTMMVDSFTLPDFSQKVTYDSLFPTATDPTLHIQPGFLPPGIDIHTATELYHTLIALNIDTSLDECLNTILSTEDANNLKQNDCLYDYYALQLLPLQKAMRGHVLQFEWYQNSLLTNMHPNFLSKVRNVNIQDTLLTHELYRKHEILQYEKRKKQEEQKLNLIINSSVDQYTIRSEKRNRRLKHGHKLINTHVTLEKDEQKRIERKAKERLQALKANDEEAYIKLLDQTKDTRITHLLKQTNAFLDSLTKAVKDQQKYTKEMIDSHLLENSEQEPSVTPQLTDAIVDEEDEDDDLAGTIDYYSVAHRIKEVITRQPTMLVGGTLKEYQLKGLQWMVSLFNNHLNGILADEMGLGKTIQTISLLTYLYETKNIHGPYLVIVPLSTLSNWSNEFAKWAPAMRAVSYKGSPAERKSKHNIIKSGEFDVVLTTFEYIIKERALLSKIKWIHMIIDEGHRMKNAQSKLSLTLNTYYHSDYRLILTGTPLQNNLPELWALLNFALPKIFNSVKSFDEWFNTPFANTGGQDKIELNEEETLLVIRRLHKVLRPFLLRRLKKDVEKDLPDKVEKVIKCQMSALQQVMYQQMLKYRRLYIGDHTNKKMVGLRGFNNQLMQLKKICNHPFVFEEVEDRINPTRETNSNIWRVAGKFELLERILPKLKATGHRVLIFFQMTQIMDIMEDFLRFTGLKYLRLDGHTKSDERSMLLQLFNEPNSEYFCFILSTRAGGLGLNLQTADTVIIFDTDWNPHQDLQAQDRAHRIGQKNEVRILRLITEHSVEEAILERAHKKLDIDGKVIQAGKFDNKSTAEEQEALLRSLLEAEEDRKKRREQGITDEETMDNNELNELLARNDGEIEIFQKIDEERTKKEKEMGIKTRLLDNSELPDVYHQDIEAEMAREESEAAAVYSGRGARERKSTHYSDNVSEEQWLRQFEVSDNEDEQVLEVPKAEKEEDVVAILNETEEGSKKRKAAGRSRGRPKKMKLVDTDVSSETAIPESPMTVENTPNEELRTSPPVEDETPPEIRVTAGKTSIKSARTNSRGRGRIRGRGRGGRGRGTRGRPPKKNGLDYIRDAKNVTESLEVRETIANQAQELFDFAVDYKDKNGRNLSDIFLQKPSKAIYPDYYLIIKYPAAYENIEKHIETKAYCSLSEVLEDFHLIFSNARIYNTEDSLVYQDSTELEEAVTKKYHEITENDDPIDFSIFDEKYATKPLQLNSSADASNVISPSS
ncbi:SWI/SNF catalytic subunit SNF2 NDAI_0K00950 [Naumovozyma dairenensis CBS 421]|uniref:Transcription regulatory protein SNF2 n=1 Tax=Naumovozyma dairenensis (strain ATCC 10597 / BCRC 20456 / CBS 421 / NBRC 0211 / NRRL Y-12639) TaxID=1071378 RepID=G0WHM5_NAUDC|nr:hypothetical protein NDAI_0K00950 [Naumovozyma dairenensis CBS 421]CCD27286.1 hypothetical protein NDAI_0K00950 [Naumovozyma dairenensis CBS 421]